MPSEREDQLLIVPREGVNDDTVRVLQWLVRDGGAVTPGQAVVVLETSKTTFELHAPGDGFVFHGAGEGAEVAVGAAVAVYSRNPVRPRPEPAAGTAPEVAGQVITARARALLQQHNLSPDLFAHIPVVRAADVEAYLSRQPSIAPGPTAQSFAGEALDPDFDWDSILRDDKYRHALELLTGLRKRMKAKYHRHVPTGDLLYDRWTLARDYGFGEGTSVYETSLILGDVRVGRNCWVGPFCVLDGSQAPLTIGDNVDIGTGAHLYTHNTIERALTGGRAPVFKQATTVGSCCFIAPNSVIAPGTRIGDHSFVAAGSYVEGAFAPNSYLAGNPARRVGAVEIHGDRARLRPGQGEGSQP